MKNYDVAIIGGGAAGLACAVTLKKTDKNISVIVIESGPRAGRKIAASGNGQGNITNSDMTARNFHGSGKKTAEKLCCSGEYDPRSLFDFLFVTDKSGRTYPAGKQASALSDSLIADVLGSGAELLLSTAVTRVDKGFGLTLSDGRSITSEYVVLAAGGKAQKQFGTDGGGFSIAKSLGHSVTPLYPSLVQLKCDTRYTKTLKGIRAECVVRLLGVAEAAGDVIFTDYGLSGNAIFSISSHLAGRKDEALSIEFLPEFSEEQIAEIIARRKAAGYDGAELLFGTLHNQIARAIVKRCQSSDPAKLAALVKNFTVDVCGTLGFDYAQVTAGGVPFSEIDGNLQSRITPKLYLVGEVADVDGDCGGYNLTWAFCSGMHAAKAICGERAG